MSYGRVLVLAFLACFALVCVGFSSQQYVLALNETARHVWVGFGLICLMVISGGVIVCISDSNELVFPPMY